MRTVSAVTLAAAIGIRAAAAAPADIRIDGRDVYPESLSSTADGTVYVGSMAGVVFRARAGSAVAEPWISPMPETGILTLFGVLADERSGTLWLCSSPGGLRPPAKVGVAALLAFDLRTGARKGAWPFPAPASICNDIAVAGDGAVYASDTLNGRIFMLKPGAAALEPFAADDRLKGIEGVVFAGDGTLYADVIRSGKLYRVDRSAHGRFAGLTELRLSRPLAGPDGFRRIAGSRFVLVEGNAGRLDRVTIRNEDATVEALRSDLMQPTGATVTRGTVYATEGKIGYLVEPKLKGQDPNPFMVRATPLPGAP